MSKLTIAADLAKDVFEVAVAKASGKIIERRRLTRTQFERFWQTREPCRVVMEACGGAHDWARSLLALGFEVMLLPAHYVRPYRQRNKTDRADCDALLEAARSPRIKPVAIKSEEQQAILALHRVREQRKDTRTEQRRERCEVAKNPGDEPGTKTRQGGSLTTRVRAETKCR